MFGRKQPQEPLGGDGKELDEPVAAALEIDLTQVAESVDAYLADPSDHRRADLVKALGLLDDETAAADAYAGQWAPYGASAKSHALGATSDLSAVGEVPVSEFDAQVALVRAAKQEVLNPSAANLAALRSVAEVTHRLCDPGGS